MNKVYAVVWSNVKQCLIVVSELAKASKKSGHKRGYVSEAVLSASMILGSMPILAAPPCPNPVDVSVVGTCSLTSSMSGFFVSSSGTISGGGGTGVTATGVSLSGSFSNTGTILGNDAINLTNTTISGSLVNSGSVGGSEYGLRIVGLSASGITNSGRLTSSHVALQGTGITLSGGILNAASGTISGTNLGLYINPWSNVQGIDNEGTINGNVRGGMFIEGSPTVKAILNSGLIQGGDFGISVGGTYSPIPHIAEGISNVGTIKGTGHSLDLNNTNSFSIYNSGTLIGNANIGNNRLVIQGASSQIAGNVTGTANSIVEIATGSVFTSSGGLFNVGTFILDSGVSFSPVDSVTASLAVTNNGTIGSFALISTPAIYNSGTILSNVDLGGNKLVIQGASSQIIGNVTGTSDSVVEIASGSAFTNSGIVFNVGTFSVDSGGSLALANTITATGGVANNGTISLGTLGTTIVGGGFNNFGRIDETLTSGSTHGTLQVSGGAASLSGNFFMDVGSVGLTNGEVISGVITADTISGRFLNVLSSSSNYWLTQTLVANNQLDLSVMTSTSSSTNTGSVGGVVGYFIGGGSPVTGFSNSGTVAAASTGIAVGTNISGAISNTGSISGTSGSGIKVSQASAEGILNSGSSAIISGNTGVSIIAGSSLSAGIVNEGQILGSSGPGIRVSSATIAGGVQNISGGVISGQTGVGLTAGSSLIGDINNSGSIVGIQNGVLISHSELYGNILNYGLIDPEVGIALVAATMVGGINNSSTITAASAGISVSGGSSISGGIFNAGAILSDSSSGIIVSASTIGGGIKNSYGGIISGQTGVSLMLGSSLTGDIDNNGSILGSNNGVLISYSEAHGNIINSGFIDTSVGISLIASTMVGGINNKSNILASSAGISVTSGSSISGGISNSGDIFVANATPVSGGSTGLGLSAVGMLLEGSRFNGQINNSGQITGSNSGEIAVSDSFFPIVGVGVFDYDNTISNGFKNSGTVVGSNSGYITYSGSHGTSSGMTGIAGIGFLSVYSEISGGFTNSGNISGYNSGLIGSDVSLFSSGDGVDLLGSYLDSFENSGRIIGSGSHGVYLYFSDITGGFVNRGLIHGGVTGVNIFDSGIQSGLTNTGTISGGDIGVYAGSSSSYSPAIGGIINSGIISGGNKSLYLQNPDAFTIENSGTLQGDAEIGSNHLVIKGNSSAIIGKVTGSSASTVDIANGGNFTNSSGIFDIGTLTINTGGTLNLANAISASGGVTNAGMLAMGVNSQTITGDFFNTGTFSETVSNTGWSHLVITGTASLSGTNFVNVSTVNNLINGATLTGVISAGTLAGNFNQVTTNSLLYQFTGLEVGNLYDLVISSNTEAIYNAALANNNLAGLGAAGVLDNWISLTNPSSGIAAVNTRLGQMTTSQQLSNAVSQTLPVLSGSTVLNSLYVIQDISKVVQSRQDSKAGMNTGDQFYGDSNLWMRPFGAWISRNNGNGAYGFDSSTGGLMFGGDTTLTDKLRLGASFAWGSSSINSNGGQAAPQSQSTNLYEFIGYGSYVLSPKVEVNTQISGGFSTNNSTRGVSFMGETAKGSYTSTNFHFATAIQRQFDVMEGTSLIPSARVDYTWINNGAYTETGANVLNLNVASQSYNVALIGGDGKIRQKLFSDDHHVIANAGVSYYMTPTSTNVLASYQGTPTLQFVTTGLAPSHVMGYAGAGYEYRVSDDLEIVGRYDVAFQSDYANQMASLKAKLSF